MSSENHGVRAVVAAMSANLGIAIAKFVGFLVTASGSMLAESIHSLADTGNQVLLLFGGRRSRRAADAQHDFGFSRERYFWAFVVAVVLFTLGAAFAVIEGVGKVLHPHELNDVTVAVVILVVAMVLEGLSFRTALHSARAQVGPDVPLWQFIRRSKSPEVPVVLLEDSAALCGLSVALVALALSAWTGDAIWDGIGTILIGLLLGTVAMILAVEMKSLLIGESASRTRRQSIQDAMLAGEEVRSVIHLRTQHLGPDDLLVAAKVEFAPTLSYAELTSAIDRTEVRVRAVEPAARLLFIEPDVRHD